jgi:hypothetical protein
VLRVALSGKADSLRLELKLVVMVTKVMVAQLAARFLVVMLAVLTMAVVVVAVGKTELEQV